MGILVAEALDLAAGLLDGGIMETATASVEFEPIMGAALETAEVAAPATCFDFKTASVLCAIQSAAAPLTAQLKKAVMNGLDFVKVRNAAMAVDAAGTAARWVVEVECTYDSGECFGTLWNGTATTVFGALSKSVPPMR